jgi:hypothetical protein
MKKQRHGKPPYEEEILGNGAAMLLKTQGVKGSGEIL